MIVYLFSVEKNIFLIFFFKSEVQLVQLKRDSNTNTYSLKFVPRAEVQ